MIEISDIMKPFNFIKNVSHGITKERATSTSTW